MAKVTFDLIHNDNAEVAKSFGTRKKTKRILGCIF